MSNLAADYFFDLTEYPHASILKNTKYVWESLKLIVPYLKSKILGNIEVEIPQGAFLIDPHLISIGKNSVIEPGAYIKGPCYIGNNCTVRHGAYIRENFICGNDCIIGHDTEIKNVIFLNGVHAAHFAYIGDSILGNHVNLGAGTKCANLKLDNQTIYVLFEGNHIDTGLRKFGAIIGDHSQIGCNAVTNPGTLLGPNVLCYPVINVGGFVPSNSLVRTNTQTSITPRQKH